MTNEEIRGGLQIVNIAQCARDFIWEPENWEAYQDSKESNSVAWPPEFLLLARAVEARYGPPPKEGAIQHAESLEGKA